LESQGVKLGDDFVLDSVAGSGVGRLDDLARRGRRDGSTMVASYARIGGPTSVPYGWADFCRRLCRRVRHGPLAPLDINLTPKT